MWEDTADYSSTKIHEKFHPQNVEKWINQLGNFKLPYLKLIILISTLKEIAESKRHLSSETISKIKKAVLFGDIGEYVEFPSTSRLTEESKGLTLLGIPKEFLDAQKIALNGKERTTVIELVEKRLEENIRSVMKTFQLESGGCTILETEWIKQVPTHLDNFVKTHQSAELMFTFYNRYRNKIESCHHEILRMGKISQFLVEARVNTISPALFHSLKVVERRDELLQVASRCHSVTIKKDIITPDTIKALEVIEVRQKEEMERKKDEIQYLKKLDAEYENLNSEGFQILLKEYLEVEKALKGVKLTLKAFTPQNHNDSNDVDVS